jgi:hypothetical protein
MKVEQGFQQVRIELPPAYESDFGLKQLLERFLPPSILKPIDQELKDFQLKLKGRKLNSSSSYY